MTRTLTNIQTSVRFYGRDDSIDLTTDPGLTVSNTVYRGLAAAFDWPEMHRRAVTVGVTVADQESYLWSGEDFPNFLDVKSVEIKSLSYDPPTTSTSVFGVSSLTEPTARYTWKHIYPPPNEFEWDEAGRRTSVDTPQYYKRYLANRRILVAADVGDGSTYWHSVNDGSTWVQSTSSAIGTEVRYYKATDGAGTGAVTASDTNKIALRPFPSTAGYALRVVGIEEPAAFTTGSSSTVFIDSAADDALSYLIAASMVARDGFGDVFQYNIRQATTLLQRLLGTEQVTQEKIESLV
jgi:hypothetical protein